LKILIVDDDADIRELMNLELKKQGHEVFFATSNEEAVNLLKEIYLDLVFLDIVLSKSETSKEIIEYIYSKENVTNFNIPIILMSAYMNANYSEEVKNKKFKIHSTLAKPFQREDLKNQIDSLRYRDVLVLDDDDDILDLMSTSLVKNNYRVVRVKTCEEAVKALSTHRLICCFLDIVLENNKSSTDVISFIDNMKNEKGITLPVVVMSAYITDDLKEQIKNSKIEIQKVLQKPFTPKQINQLVDEIEIMVSSRTQIDCGFVDNTKVAKKISDESITITDSSKTELKKDVVETSDKSHSREEYTDDVTLVKGKKDTEEDESKTIKGSKEGLNENMQVIKGTTTGLEEKDHFTRVKESAGTEGEKDYHKVTGNPEEGELSDAQRVKGNGEGNISVEAHKTSYEEEDTSQVKGSFSGSEAQDSMLVKGVGVEEKEEFTRVKGKGSDSESDEDKNIHRIKGEKEELSDTMKFKGGDSSLDETPDKLVAKGSKEAADETNDKLIAKGSAEERDVTPEKIVAKGNKELADKTPEKQVAKGNKELADESKIAGMKAGKEGAEANKVDIDNKVAINQYNEKIDENEIMGTVKTSMESNELEVNMKQKGTLESAIAEDKSKMAFADNGDIESNAQYKMQDKEKEGTERSLVELDKESSVDGDSSNTVLKQKLAKQMEYFKKKSINERNDKGMTSLMVAARYGQVDMCRDLMANGAEVSLRSKDGKSAIHFAVISCNLPTVLYFLQNGGKVNSRDDNNLEPLYEAIKMGNVEMTKYLIDNGARTTARVKGLTYLMVAAQKGDTEIFKFLIDQGLRLDQRDLKGNTAIDYAKKKKRREILLYVKELLKQQKQKP